eukprot:gene21004-27863_t
MLSWLFNSAPKKSKELLEAEVFFEKGEELPRIRRHIQSAVPHTKGGAGPSLQFGLNKAQFLSLCDLHQLDQLDASIAQRVYDVMARGSPVLTEEDIIIMVVCDLHLLDQLDASFVQRVSHVMARGSPALTEVGIIIAKAKLERMGDRTAQELTFLFLSPDESGTVNYSALSGALTAFTTLALGQTNKADVLQSLAPSSINAILAGAAKLCQGSGDSQQYGQGSGAHQQYGQGSATDSTSPDPQSLAMNVDMYCSWCKSCPALHVTLASLLQEVGRAYDPQVPDAAAEARHVLPTVAPKLLDDRGELVLSLCGFLLQPAYAYVLAGCLCPGDDYF